jgi:hypothetical protein
MPQIHMYSKLNIHLTGAITFVHVVVKVLVRIHAANKISLNYLSLATFILNNFCMPFRLS